MTVTLPAAILAPTAEPVTRRPVRGPALFARYAYGPNLLGYCGPDDAAELFGQATRGGDEASLRRLAGQFDGAFPYLQLIARANGLADPLDARVVEAYWLGNDLLRRVTPVLMGESLDLRFRRRLGTDGWRWLADKPNTGALPMHAFHVLDVLPRFGLLRGGSVDDVLGVIDSCRIRWGRVLERDGDYLVVSAAPLAMAGGKLQIAPPRVQKVRAWQHGAGFVGGTGAGDVVSIHWDWACDRLDPARLDALRAWTQHELGIANLTM